MPPKGVFCQPNQGGNLKKILIILTLVTANTFAADLLRFEKKAGFEMHPTNVTVSLTTDGQILKTVTRLQENIASVVSIGALTSETMRLVKNKMKAVNQTALYADDQADQPMCMDAPSYLYRMKAGKKYLNLKLESNCHETYLHDGQGMELVKFIEGLEAIARMN